jgi:hypothetical protein
MTLLYHLQAFEKFRPDTLYLIIFHADKKPPHIGLVWNLRYFSLTTKGFEVDLPVEEKLLIVEKRKIPCLIIELKATVHDSNNATNLLKIFKSYGPLKPNDTCIAPITEYLESIYKVKLTGVLLHGLISELQKHALIERNYALHLLFSKTNTYELPQYDKSQITMRINRLILLDNKKLT